MARAKKPFGTSACGCGIGAADEAGEGAVPSAGRKAVTVDAELKEQNVRHLRRVEGQVRGILRMVDEDRYCADIITQIAAARESLQSVAKTLLRNHVRHCASAAIRKGDPEANAMYDEIIDLVGRMSR